MFSKPGSPRGWLELQNPFFPGRFRGSESAFQRDCCVFVKLTFVKHSPRGLGAAPQFKGTGRFEREFVPYSPVREEVLSHLEEPRGEVKAECKGHMPLLGSMGRGLWGFQSKASLGNSKHVAIEGASVD